MLLDSSFVYALYSADDRYHARSIAFAQNTSINPQIPSVVLTEVSFLFLRDGGYLAYLKFINRFSKTKQPILEITHVDLERAAEIATEYADAQFDFVDTCLMALSERLNITQICTFDRRDFSMFRPRHTDYLELLPE